MGYKDPWELKYELRGPTVGKAWATMTHETLKLWVTRTHRR